MLSDYNNEQDQIPWKPIVSPCAQRYSINYWLDTSDHGIYSFIIPQTCDTKSLGYRFYVRLQNSKSHRSFGFTYMLVFCVPFFITSSLYKVWLITDLGCKHEIETPRHLVCSIRDENKKSLIEGQMAGYVTVWPAFCTTGRPFGYWSSAPWCSEQ